MPFWSRIHFLFLQCCGVQSDFPFLLYSSCLILQTCSSSLPTLFHPNPFTSSHLKQFSTSHDPFLFSLNLFLFLSESFIRVSCIHLWCILLQYSLLACSNMSTSQDLIRWVSYLLCWVSWCMFKWSNDYILRPPPANSVVNLESQISHAFKSFLFHPL